MLAFVVCVMGAVLAAGTPRMEAAEAAVEAGRREEQKGREYLFEATSPTKWTEGKITLPTYLR